MARTYNPWMNFLMSAVVRISKAFARQAKPLLKKYASLAGELRQLQQELQENSSLGKELFTDVHKIRLSIKSKGKGKSGGARVISYLHKSSDAEVVGVITEAKDDTYIINLIAIYDKSETATITDKEIRNLIDGLQ